MKRRFAIKNAVDNKYWYGYYSSKNWTDDILEAKLFDSKQELDGFIESNAGDLYGMFLIVVEVFV